MGAAGVGCGIEGDPLKDCLVINSQGLGIPFYCVPQQAIRFLCSYPGEYKHK